MTATIRKMIFPANTVVVEVLGGVADVTHAPEDVHVLIVDYDNDPDATVKLRPDGTILYHYTDDGEDD